MPLQNNKTICFQNCKPSVIYYIFIFKRKVVLIIFTRTTLVWSACRSGERKLKTQLEKFLNSRVYIHGILGF